MPMIPLFHVPARHLPIRAQKTPERVAQRAQAASPGQLSSKHRRAVRMATKGYAAIRAGPLCFMRLRNSVGDSSAMRRKLRLKWDRLWKPTS